MSGIKRELRIKKAIENKLWNLLKDNSKGEVPKEQLQAVSLGIKYLAVSAKLGEADWGKDIAKLGDVEDPADALDGEKGGLDDDGPEDDF